MWRAMSAQAVGHGIAETPCALRRVEQRDVHRHVHVGAVVDRLLAFGDAHRLTDFIAPSCLRDPAGDPLRHSRQHRPRLLAQEMLVPGGVGVLGEGVRDPRAHMLLVPCPRAGQRRLLLAARRVALPGKLQPPVAVQLGVGARGGERAAAIVEHRPRGIRLREQQRRDGERLDVPHHMAVVVVVIGPLGQPEDGRARPGRGMDGGLQIEERRVGKRLPTAIRPEQMHPALPQLRPCRLILRGVARRNRDRARGRQGGSPVDLVGDASGWGPSPRSAAAGTTVRVRRGRHSGWRAALLPSHHGAFRRRVILEGRDVGHPAGGKAAQRLPMHHAVYCRCLRAGRLGPAVEPASGDVAGIDPRRQRHVAGLMHRDAHLLEDKAGLDAATERQYVHARFQALDGEHEAAMQLAAGEIVALLDASSAVRHIGEPEAPEAQVATERVGCVGCAFDPRHGVHASETIDDSDTAA